MSVALIACKTAGRNALAAMYRMREYVKEVFWRSFASWERGEALTNALVIIGGLIASAVPALAIDASFQDRIIVGLAGFFGLMIFIVSPFRIWRDAKDRIEELECKIRPKLLIIGVNPPEYKVTSYPGSEMLHTCYVDVVNNSQAEAITEVNLRVVAFEPDNKRTIFNTMVLPQTFPPKAITIAAGTSQKWKICSGTHFAPGEDSNPVLNVEVDSFFYKIVWNRVLIKLEVSGVGTSKSEEEFYFQLNKSNAPCLIPINEYDKWRAANT